MKFRLVILAAMLSSVVGYATGYNPDDFMLSAVDQSRSPRPLVSVYAVIQDSYGYMWMGGADALVRYDGQNFQEFPLPGKMEGNGVRTLCEDTRGRIWVGSRSGICILDPSDRSMTIYDDHPVNNIISTQDGQLWVAAQHQGFLRIDPVTDKCDTLAFEYDSASSHYGTAVTTDGQTVYCLNGVGTVYTGKGREYGLKTLAFHLETPFNMKHAAKMFYFEGKLVAGVPNQSFIYDIATGQSEERPWSVVQNIVRSGEHVFLASNSGLYVLDDDLKEVFHYSSDKTSDISFRDTYIPSLYLDRDGALWVGTNFNGIYRLERNTIGLRHFASPSRSGDKYLVRYITQTPDKRIWVTTTDNGLLQLRDGVLKQFPLPVDTKDILGVGVVGDNLMVGCSSLNSSLCSVNWKTGATSVYPYVPSTCYSFFALSDTQFYVGSSNRFSYVDTKQKLYRREEVIRSTATAIMRDSLDRMWVATASTGLWEYSDNVWRHFQEDEGVPQYIADAIMVGGKVWMCTQDRGIVSFDINTCRSRSFKVFGGQTCNKVRCAACDKEGMIWMTTSNGIATIDPETLATAIYTHKDGLMYDEYGFSTLYCADDGTLYAGTNIGLLAFDCAALKRDASADNLRKVHFCELVLPDGAAVPLDDRSRVEVRHADNVLELHVSDMSYATPRRYSLSYSVDADGQWNTSANGVIALGNLSSGLHRVSVRMVDHQSEVASAPGEIEIYVEYPGWIGLKAIAVYILCLAMLCGLGYAVTVLVRRSKASRQTYSSPVVTLQPSVAANVSDAASDASFAQKISEYVYAHISDDDLNVTQLASFACMSTSSLLKKMKAVMGTGPKEYIMQARMKTAAQMLRDKQDLTVVQISERVGFNSPAYFSSCFKAQYGCTPGQYRGGSTQNG